VEELEPNLTPVGWIWDEPDIITQHQCLTSLMLLCLNGSKFTRLYSNI